MICGLELTDLTRAIYPNIENGQALTNQYFLEHVILCPRNVKVGEINSLMRGLFPGGSRTYSSADSIQGAKDGAQYLVEYLNSINTGGLPPSQLEVKIGVPLMLLRNLDPGLGLCNGTSLRLMRIINRVLHVKIINGSCAEEMTFIPRIKLISSEELPFELHRVQFPVRLAFGMTINKSQGQSLGTVGLELCNPVFGHR